MTIKATGKLTLNDQDFVLCYVEVFLSLNRGAVLLSLSGERHVNSKEGRAEAMRQADEAASILGMEIEWEDEK